MKYAVIKLAGKQYRASEGDLIVVDNLNVSAGEKMTIDEALMIRDDDKTEIGTPTLKTSVVLEAVKDFKDKKVRVAIFKAKSRYRKVKGHRQSVTRVKVISIGKKAETKVKKATKSK